MSICIHIPFYNPSPNETVGYRKLTRYEYLKENIENLKKLPHPVDIFVNTHNRFLDDKDLGVNIVKHNLSESDLNRGILTWKTRNNMKQYASLYDYFIYIEHDIKFTESNFEYWKEYNQKLKGKRLNLGFLIFERSNEDNSKYSVHLSNKINKILIIDNEKYAINDVENYCCFWIYDKNFFHKFINSKWWNVNSKVTNYRHTYGNCEKVAIGMHALNIGYFKATIIPIQNNNFDERCKIEHLTNNYFYKFKDVKFLFSDIRSACRFKLDELISDKIKYYYKLPINLNLKDRFLWKFRFINKIFRLINRYREK